MGRCSTLANSLSCFSSASERLIVVLFAIQIMSLYAQLHISILLFFHVFDIMITVMQKLIIYAFNNIL